MNVGEYLNVDYSDNVSCPMKNSIAAFLVRKINAPGKEITE